MPANAILCPLLAMVGLTFVVWITMFVRRVGEMRRRRIAIERLATTAEIASLLDDRRAADNFRNLFEMPVLFYAGALAALATGAADSVVLGLAWAFVVFRALHSLVHCSYNRVMHRFLAYLLAAVAVWAMWVKLAVTWLA